MVLLAMSWVLYFVLHSTLASLQVKNRVYQKWPESRKYYRLVFNMLSLVLLFPPLYLLYTANGTLLWQWQGVFKPVQLILSLLVFVGFVYTSRAYDMAEFIGTRQLQKNDTGSRLGFSGIHRFVRHPWYFLALVYIWSRDMDSHFLVSAVLMTLYFMVGSVLEDRKLEQEHGEEYREYRRKVPGLIPWPGKYSQR